MTMITSIPLDIRCPSHHRILNDTLDQASRRIIVQHGDLQCLRHFPLRVFQIKTCVSPHCRTDYNVHQSGLTCSYCVRLFLVFGGNFMA